MSKKTVHVAVGVIVNEQQQILIALRPAHTHQGGLWEFPGGKVETGETVQQALARELEEELGIRATGFDSLINIHHDYGDKAVYLDVWWVNQFNGQAEGKEGQPLQWVCAADLASYRFPEANMPILAAVQKQLLSQA